MQLVMRFSLIVALALAVCAPANADDESREPTVKYRLDVDGKSYPIVEGEPLKIPGTLTNPTLTITAGPHREFTYGGVSFLYPRSFIFEADIKDPDTKTWILSGKDFKIMYFLLAGDQTVDLFADSMMEQFGKGNSRRSAITRELLGRKLAGIRLDVTLAGHKLTTDILRLPGQGRTRLLVLQDSPDETGQASKESREALEVFKKSIALK